MSYKLSKRHPFHDPSTGPDVAKEYRLKHPKGLKQLQRYLRILVGERPLKYDVPSKRERKVASKLKLRRGQ